MIIQKIPISKINPAPYNPRKDLQPGDAEYEKIKRSIMEFDLVEPLVVNKRTGNLVGGHQRLKVLKELGKTEVEAVIVDLPESREKALNVALNKAQGEWDLPKLKDLLQELDTGEFDIGITGFDVDEIEDLMTQLYEPDENEQDDQVPEVPEEPTTKKGDLYKLGEHRLLCGDATSIDDVQRLMDGQKADMVFTDPPYNQNFKSRTIIKGEYKKLGIKNDNIGLSDYIGLLDNAFGNLFGFCKAGAFYYFCTSYRVYSLFEEYITKYIKNIHTCIVWVKDTFGMGQAYRNKHEFIIFVSNNKGVRFHNKTEVNVWEFPSATSFSFRRSDNNGESILPHPTMKPIKLISRALNNSSKSEDIVLDTFGGSGSTLIACEKLNRKCYMMELDEHYCDVIVKRWEDYTGKKAELI